MAGPDPTQHESDAGDPRADHLHPDLPDREARASGDGAPTGNRPASGARVVSPGSRPEFAPEGGADFLDLGGSGDDAGSDPARQPGAPASPAAGDLYSDVERPMLDIDVDAVEDGPRIPADPSPAEAQGRAEESFEPNVEPVTEPEASDAASAGGGLDMDLDLDMDDVEPTPAPPAAKPQPAASSGGGLSLGLDDDSDAESEALAVDPQSLEFDDEAPEGVYDRPEEAEALAVPEGPVAIGDDEQQDDGIFAADELDIDFDAPVERVGPPRGALVGAALAGALMTAALAVVDPGDEVEVVVPGIPVAIVDEGVDAEPVDTESVGTGAFDVSSTSDVAALLGFAPAGAGLSFGGPDRAAAPEPSGAPEPVEFEPVEFEAESARPFEGLPSDAELAALLAAAGGMSLPQPPAAGPAPDAPENTTPVAIDDAAELDRAVRTAELDLMAQVNLPEDRSGIRFVTQEDLEEIWLGSELPARGIDSRRNRLTPHVGPVRLTTDLGEVFEGELYSIGGGEVSLSTHLGRITFAARQVELVQRLPAVASDPGNPASLPGERVRAKTPGGWIQGRILSRNGARVTLITEGGGRITLEGVEIQPLGQRSAGAFLAGSGD